MNMNAKEIKGIKYTEGEYFGVGNLRTYITNEGYCYFIGANTDLEKLYDVLDHKYIENPNPKENYVPRYDVHPLMNMNRSYGLEIRDGKFAIVTAENLVDRILKW